MRNLIILAIFLTILPSTMAAVTLTIEPSTQTIQPGENFAVNVVLDNSETIWGFSFKLYEEPIGAIFLSEAQPQQRISGGLNSATELGDKVTVFSAFAGSSAGIPAGTGAVYTLHYSVPASATPGTYQLEARDLYVSNSQGFSVPATVSGTTVEVEDNGYAGLWLPDISTKVGKTADATLCATNTHPGKELKGIDVTIKHNSAIAEVENVQLLKGTGSSSIEKGSTHITATGTSVQSSDCGQNSGVSIAKITYKGLSAGKTALSFSTIELSDGQGQLFSVQTGNREGELDVTGQSTSSGSGGGGGGGGSSVKTATDTCRKCPEGKYTCCGATTDYVSYLCRRPETYTNLCKTAQTEAATQQALPPTQFFTQIEPTNEYVPTIKTEEPKPAESKPQIPQPAKEPSAPQLQTPMKQETPDIGFSKIIMAVIIVLAFGALIAYATHRPKHPPASQTSETKQKEQPVRHSNSAEIIRKKLEQSKK